MNGRAIPWAYLFRPYVCDKEMSWPHHIGETHQPDWVVYVRDINLWEITFRLTNVIPERIIFVSRGITVSCFANRLSCSLWFRGSWCSTCAEGEEVSLPWWEIHLHLLRTKMAWQLNPVFTFPHSLTALCFVLNGFVTDCYAVTFAVFSYFMKPRENSLHLYTYW
jgi:hypothetical protein